MQFGQTIGKACLTFVITNIDDAFVLVTFFAESSTSSTLTPLKITLGQYLGFTVILAISLIGFGVAIVLPTEPIGFLGLLPLLLGVWKFFGLLFPKKNESDETQPSNRRIAKATPILKVAIITLINGGDNISTYIPLFSQTKGAEIAVYVVVYYILLGVWCLIAYFIMKQKHILRIAQKYAAVLVPFLYLGLGIYIVTESECYPWTVQEIDDQFVGNPGKVVMGVVTTFLLSSIMGIMVWARMRAQGTREEIRISHSAGVPSTTEREGVAMDAVERNHCECLKSNAEQVAPVLADDNQTLERQAGEGRTESRGQ